MELLKRTGT